MRWVADSGVARGAGDHVLQGPAVAQAHGVALVVVVATTDRGDVAVRGVGDDLVEVGSGTAVVERDPVQPRAGEQRPGSEQDLRPVVGGHRPQPAGLSTVHPAGQPGVDQHEPQRPHVDRAVRAGLDRVLGVGVAVPAGGGELLGGGGRRAPPEHAAHRPRPHGAGRGGQRRAGVGRGVAEDGHEAGEAVVPVGGAGDAVDRGGVVGVRREQALLVGRAGPLRVRRCPRTRRRGRCRPRRPAGPARRRSGSRGPRPGRRARRPTRGRAARSGRRPGRPEGPARPRCGPTRRGGAARAGGLPPSDHRAGARAGRCGRRTGDGGAGDVGVGPAGGRPQPAASGADRDDGPDGGGGSAGTAARSSRDHGRNHMARIVAGSPPVAQRQREKITRCDRIRVRVTRLSGVHRRRGGRATSHDRRPRSRVPEVRDRPDGREDS